MMLTQTTTHNECIADRHALCDEDTGTESDAILSRWALALASTATASSMGPNESGGAALLYRECAVEGLFRSCSRLHVIYFCALCP